MRTRIAKTIVLSLKSVSIRYQAFCCDAEIKRAYGASLTEHPSLIIPGIVLNNPVKSIVLPLIAALSLAVFAVAKTWGPSLHSTRHDKPAAVAAPLPIEHMALAPKKPEALPPSKTFIYSLLADKSKKKLTLFKFYSDGSVRYVKKYNIAIGENWGRKEKRGDLKTPEGFYWLIDVMEDEVLPPIYGIRAFVTNYPNEQDRSEHRSGVGIWIHGCEKGKTPDKTKGCLELGNDDLAEVSKFITIGTPIFIAEAIASPDDSIRKYFDWDDIFKQRAYIYELNEHNADFAQSFVEEWSRAWQSKDIEKYSSMYSEDFSQDNMSFNEWKEYKRSIFAKAGAITVRVSNIKLQKMFDDSAYVRFVQDYESETYRSSNAKIIKLVRSNDDWKIQRESIETQ